MNEACPLCGSTSTFVCYGLALGGLGPYEVCEGCDAVIWKQVNEPGQCLHGLDSPSGREPEAGSGEPSGG